MLCPTRSLKIELSLSRQVAGSSKIAEKYLCGINEFSFRLNSFEFQIGDS